MTTNNKHLVDSGREYAANIDINTVIIDIVRKMTELTEALAAEVKRSEAQATENSALNDKMNKLATWPGIEFYSSAWEFNNNDGNAALEFMCDVKTPATDVFMAEVRAQARREGAYFVANRMLAAWDAGFIDDTAKNAADIARMILTSTEFMADAPEGDFNRSFADGVLEEIADTRCGNSNGGAL